MRPVVGDVEAEMFVVGSIQLGYRKHVTTFEQQISLQAVKYIFLSSVLSGAEKEARVSLSAHDSL